VANPTARGDVQALPIQNDSDRLVVEVYRGGLTDFLCKNSPEIEVSATHPPPQFLQAGRFGQVLLENGQELLHPLPVQVVLALAK
jgi:hypothetical protein